MRLIYPIRGIYVGDFPLLDEIIVGSREVATKIGFDPNTKQPSKEFVREVTIESVAGLLEHARQSGNLEPLTSLVYFLIPGNAFTASKDIAGHDIDKMIQQFLLPYEKHIESMMMELSQNIIFQAQITPDNIWGEEILGRGLLLMKSGGNYIVYKYSVETGVKSHVSFERLPDLNSPDLESTIRRYHNPNSVESPVLVRTKKPYHAKGDILPYFAYRFTGLKNNNKFNIKNS